MPRFLKPPSQESLTPLMEGEEAWVSIVKDEGQVERRQKREKSYDHMQIYSPLCEGYTRFWTHKFVHKLFPQYSINVRELHIPQNIKGEVRMYSDIVTHKEKPLQNLRNISTKILQTHANIKTLIDNNQVLSAHEKFKQTSVQVQKFDVDILKQYGKDIDTIQTKMEKYGIKIKHPEINMIIEQRTNRLVFTEFDIINTGKAQQAISKMTEEERKELHLDKKTQDQLLKILRKINVYQILEKKEEDYLYALQRIKKYYPEPEFLQKKEEIELLLESSYQFLVIVVKYLNRVITKTTKWDIDNIKDTLDCYLTLIRDVLMIQEKVKGKTKDLIEKFLLTKTENITRLPIDSQVESQNEQRFFKYREFQISRLKLLRELSCVIYELRSK